MKKLLTKLLDLIFPRYCLSCYVEGQYLCAKCLLKLKLFEEQVCPVCKSNCSYGLVCSGCRIKAKDLYFDGLWVLAPYDNKIFKKLIHQFKYKFSKDLSELFTNLIIENFDNQLIKSQEISLIIPVPLDTARLNFRGFNQAKVLALEFAKAMRMEKYIIDVLKRSKAKRQAELTKEERIKNVKGIYSMKENLRDFVKNKGVLLIDDVATTTSTINACSKCLKESGAKMVVGLVLARG